MTPLEKTLRWIVIGGVFVLPFVCLYVANNLFFPFITGKNFTFRIVVEIITATWLALTLVRPEYRPRGGLLLGAFAVFAIIVALADAHGVYPFKSFWSNYERMDGWVTLAHLFAYIVVSTSVLNTEKLWKRLFQVSLGVSVYLALYGFLQIAGISTLGQGGSAGLGARIDATFGNPIYLAAYMLFHIFIAGILWSQAWIEKGPGRRNASSWVYGSIIFLDTVALLFTGTRGTTLGLIGGALISGILLVLLSRESRSMVRMGTGIVVALLVVFTVFWFARDTAFVHKIGFLERLATISASEATVKARFLNWGMAWEGVKERPLLGWGQENYAIVFDKYYDPRMYAQEQWFDRVHNIVFDWLVAAGFLGLFGYLSLFVCALWIIWRTKRAGNQMGTPPQDEFSPAEKSLLTGLLAGYFFHNLFVFDNITSYILFATVYAYIAFRVGVAENRPPLLATKQLPSPALPIITVCVAIVLWGVAWEVSGKALAQNRVLLKALSPQKEGIQKNFEYFKEAIAYGSFGTQEAREQVAQGAMQIASNKEIPIDMKSQFFDLAVHELGLQGASSPLDARAPLFLGVLLDAYGNYADALPALQRAHDLSLKKQTILFELAQNAQFRGDVAGALKASKEAYELAPDFNSARIVYATLLIVSGQDTLADEILAPIMKTGAAGDTRIAAAYAGRGRYDKIVSIWKARAEAHPKDPQTRFTLAAALYVLGRPGEAIAQLEDISRIDPTTKAQADSLIDQIRKGTFGK